MVSSQKDRVMIVGGKEQLTQRGIDDSNIKSSSTVEEIDFLKRRIISLAPLKFPRSNSSAFHLNDSIYVFGGCINPVSGSAAQIQNCNISEPASMMSQRVVGERYVLRENRWKEIKPSYDPTQPQ